MEVDQIADEILWARVLAGEPAAYADLYRRHADRVFTHCFRRLADRTDAEDVTAEAFAEVWRQRDRVQLDDEAGLLPWLLGTANNLLRRQQRERRIGLSRARFVWCRSQAPRYRRRGGLDAAP